MTDFKHSLYDLLFELKMNVIKFQSLIMKIFSCKSSVKYLYKVVHDIFIKYTLLA
jgi:hypothetical protein